MTAAVGWTVSFDDGLCQRLNHCTLCGRALQPTGWFEILTLLIPPTGIGVALCPACHQHDREYRQVLATLTARYGGHD
jgi:hypothetical protein